MTNLKILERDELIIKCAKCLYSVSNYTEHNALICQKKRANVFDIELACTVPVEKIVCEDFVNLTEKKNESKLHESSLSFKILQYLRKL